MKNEKVTYLIGSDKMNGQVFINHLILILT